MFNFFCNSAETKRVKFKIDDKSKHSDYIIHIKYIIKLDYYRLMNIFPLFFHKNDSVLLTHIAQSHQSVHEYILDGIISLILLCSSFLEDVVFLQYTGGVASPDLEENLVMDFYQSLLHSLDHFHKELLSSLN